MRRCERRTEAEVFEDGLAHDLSPSIGAIGLQAGRFGDRDNRGSAVDGCGG